MELADFARQVQGFDAATPSEKIRLFGWFLHAHRNAESFSTAEIRQCYDRLHLPAPDVAKYLKRMTESRPQKALRDGANYKLSRASRLELDGKYGAHQTFIMVSKILGDLPGKLSNLSERNFLVEAVSCYQVGAFRACVVMTWNMTYSHLLHWVLRDVGRLAAFNSAIVKRFPKRAGVSVATYDDFSEELKESEVIEVCNTAGLLNGNVVRILREKLGKRNIAAHPSAISIVQAQADDVITDLVNNVVVALT